MLLPRTQTIRLEEWTQEKNFFSAQAREFRFSILAKYTAPIKYLKMEENDQILNIPKKLNDSKSKTCHICYISIYFIWSTQEWL